MRIFRKMRRAFAGIAGAGVALAVLPAPAAENLLPVDPAEISVTEVKQLFAGQCSWCHGDFGMKADKGPQLAGTQMTEKQVFDLVKNGKSGLMPSFKKALNDEQIAAISRYIKSLKPET